MKSWTRRGAAALAVFVPFSLNAQTPPADEEEVYEEIVVTATKRETSLQDVPFSVAAVTSESLTESGATNLAEVARNVPGLYVTDLGPGQSQVAIRGISAGQVVRDQPGVKESVGIYLDESPVSVALFTPDLDLYDLDRIEVLRGPQGTLFGAGSTSGTVRYITAQPDLGTFAGSVDLTVDGAEDGDYGGGLRGSINVPFGEKAAMRAVGLSQRTSGIHRLRLSGPRDARGREQRHAHRRAPRVSLRADRKLLHHAARDLPGARDRRLSAHRRVQHPRQSLYDDRTGRRSGRTRTGHAVSRRPDRRVPHGRPEARLRIRRRHRAHLGDHLHRSQCRSGARCEPAHGQRELRHRGRDARRSPDSTRR